MDESLNNIENNNNTTSTTLNPNKRKIIKLKREKKSDFDEDKYKNMNKDELISEIKRLNSHVKQLKILFDRTTTISSSNNNNNKNNQTKKEKSACGKERPFDFSKFNKRHILLKFAYLGWNYQGFTTQEGLNDTVENHLFKAFVKTKLIEERQTSNYHRCGRTDKGVSAFCQVISIDFRSNCKSGVGLIVNQNSTVTNDDIKNEINYVKLLNGVLPDDIRVLAWCPVDENFSSRFDCDKRIYRYYFPKGDLDIDAMREASNKLIGEHDFRNFCKMDVANGVVTFYRRIDNITVNLLGNSDNSDIYSIVELIIEGSSFLWHQVRNMTAILLLIGQLKEETSIIDDLLNINKWPCKPQYNIVSEMPLILFDCSYNNDNVKWLFNNYDLEKTIIHLQNIWIDNQIKSTMIKTMLINLENNLKLNNNDNNTKNQQFDDNNRNNEKFDNVRTMKQPYKCLEGKTVCLNYVKLHKRPTSDSLENRVEHYIKRKKIDRDFVNEKLAEQSVLLSQRDNENNSACSSHQINKTTNDNNNDYNNK